MMMIMMIMYAVKTQVTRQQNLKLAVKISKEKNTVRTIAGNKHNKTKLMCKVIMTQGDINY